MGGHEVTLVDTSSWIEFLRGRNTEPGLRVRELVRTERAAWCDLIAVELWNGVRRGDETKSLTELETAVTVYLIDQSVWQKARKLAYRSQREGITAPLADIIIAACAARYNLEIEHLDDHYDLLMPIAAKV